MLIPFKTCLEATGKVSGIIHIGAHHAEEAGDYAASGVEHVLWLEANPALLDEIEKQSNAAGLKTAIVTGYAISNVDNELVTLNVTNNGQSSSILELGTHEVMYPHIHVVDKKEVRTQTVKTLLQTYNLKISDYQFINIDIQGAELLALQGFDDLLSSPSLSGIYLEINFDEVYKGCPLVIELDEYLAKFGFYRHTTATTPYGWGDALYVRVPENELKLSFSNSTVRGPGKVVTNLIKGLGSLGVKLVKDSKNVGILQPTSALLNESPDAIIGPNVFVLPSDMPQVVNSFSKFIVPSKWVADLYKRDLEKLSLPKEREIDLLIWSAGIDTEHWKPSLNAKQNKCFIYFKNRSEKELHTLEKIFQDKYGFDVEVLRYGSYNEEDLKRVCNESKFCVLLDNTESQGIAVMEILSMNVPILAFDMTVWSNPNGDKEQATSIPYFDNRCGAVCPNHVTKEFVDGFLLTLPKFKPREYILENHTLIQAAGRYMRCFSE
jgi:FkbM family methyltransferase